MWWSWLFVGVVENITQPVNKAITSLEVSKDNTFRNAFCTLKLLPATMNSWQSFSKPERLQFEFIALNTRLVQILFPFIVTFRMRNWLNICQGLLEDFIAMDRIKYRKPWLVYIAEMKKWKLKIQTSGTISWKKNLSVQKSDTPVVVIRCGQARKQFNRENKAGSWLNGIPKNQNIRNLCYLPAPVRAQLQEEMTNKWLVFTSSHRKHHQLSILYVHRQWIRILKLLDVLPRNGFRK